MKNDLLERMEIVLKYTDLALVNLEKETNEIMEKLKKIRYEVTVDELVKSFKIIKKYVSKWIANYKISQDPLCISIKEYSLVCEEVNILINECVLIDELYAEIIDYSFAIIGEELSTAIKNGGNIDNANIEDLFNLFIDSLNNMIEDIFYENDKNLIIELKKKVLSWKNNYEDKKKLTIISFDDISKIYQYVKDVCEKYKMLEDINKNYAEKIQYCYAKLEALREKKLRDK